MVFSVRYKLNCCVVRFEVVMVMTCEVYRV